MMKIACWSGPRNISTALMRSWSSRIDTLVSDEPFYACYLKKKDLKHPMYKEIINHYENDYKNVIQNITAKIPNSRNIWYQKHMAHHIIDYHNLEWITNFNNCFLVRNPASVINSYIKKNQLSSSEELGYIQQYKMIKFLKKKGEKCFVIDSSLLLQNPELILSKWCEALNIEFDSNMLHWDQKIYSTDGIWAQHWYDNVIKTQSFQKFEDKNVLVKKEYYDIYLECKKYYEYLIQYSL